MAQKRAKHAKDGRLVGNVKDEVERALSVLRSEREHERFKGVLLPDSQTYLQMDKPEESKEELQHYPVLQDARI